MDWVWSSTIMVIRGLAAAAPAFEGHPWVECFGTMVTARVVVVLRRGPLRPGGRTVADEYTPVQRLLLDPQADSPPRARPHHRGI